VLGYVGATIVESACLNMLVTRDAVDDHGLIPSEEIRTHAARALPEAGAPGIDATVRS
jgi:hypothetical protein